jgi:NADH-quinone oxidoreductase subunit N
MNVSAMNLSAIDWSALFHATLPETALEVTALLVLIVDIAFLRRTSHWLRFRAAGILSFLGILFAAVCILSTQPITVIADGMVAISPAGKVVELGLLAITALCLFFTFDEDFTDHVGEFVALMLFATIGGMLMATTLHLLVIFLSLELLSLSLYILTAFNKRSIQSSEAALKYFLFGGMSAAMLLFGFSLFYGIADSCNVTQISISLAKSSGNDSHLMVLATLMVIMGFGFKVAAAPLHWWAPDVYQGAPAPAAMFIGSASKLASFFLFWNLLVAAVNGWLLPSVSLFSKPGDDPNGWGINPHYPYNWGVGILMQGTVFCAIISLAAVSMLWGNLAALAQTNVRRLLGYSAIAHSGYILLAFLGNGDATRSLLPALIFYILTYSIAVIGAFAIASIVERETGSSDLANFAGLSKRSPLTAFCLLIFVLSMAGIPPLAGFFAKFNLFALFWQQQPGLWWLVALAIAMSAVSLFYYLQVLKHAYVVEPTETAAAPAPQSASMLTRFVLLLCALVVIILGCNPQPLLGLLNHALSGMF